MPKFKTAARMDDRRFPIQRALAVALVSEADFLRLQAIAKLYARGLNDVSWRDLLNEAIARVLEGKRQAPDGVAMVAFLAGVMRSLRADHHRRMRLERACLPAVDAQAALAAVDPAPDPEHRLAIAQQLAAIDRLFAKDRQALQVINGLTNGASPKEIQKLYGLSETEYESTRKRIRRALLREGLARRKP
jgi:RNA polymerase sigma-70 factor (ECF subfamily)